MLGPSPRIMLPDDVSEGDVYFIGNGTTAIRLVRITILTDPVTISTTWRRSSSPQACRWSPPLTPFTTTTSRYSGRDSTTSKAADASCTKTEFVYLAHGETDTFKPNR